MDVSDANTCDTGDNETEPSDDNGVVSKNPFIDDAACNDDADVIKAKTHPNKKRSRRTRQANARTIEDHEHRAGFFGSSYWALLQKHNILEINASSIQREEERIQEQVHVQRDKTKLKDSNEEKSDGDDNVEEDEISSDAEGDEISSDVEEEDNSSLNDDND